VASIVHNTAYNRSFLVVQSGDHLTGLTGASPLVTLSKNGGAFSLSGGEVTEIGSGWYSIALTLADADTLGTLALHVVAAGGDPTDFIDQVVADVIGTLSDTAIVQNAGTAFAFLMVSSADHVTGLTGAFPVVSLSKAGGSFVPAYGIVSETGDGWYQVDLTASDDDTLGDLVVHATATSADPSDSVGQVVPLTAWPYTLTNSANGQAIEGAQVWVSRDAAGLQPITVRLVTDSSGSVLLYLPVGALYLWRSKDGWVFNDPQTITVAPVGSSFGTGTLAPGPVPVASFCRPTLNGFLFFIRHSMKIPASVLPNDSFVIPMAYETALQWVNRAIAAVSPRAYVLAVYNLGGSNVINYAADDDPTVIYRNYEDQPQPYFEYFRALWKINDFVTGVVQASGDNSTSVSLQLQEAFSNLTLEDLQNLKDPFGRRYMAIAQQYGTLWGLTT
jgi:hypothetical protein